MLNIKQRPKFRCNEVQDDSDTNGVEEIELINKTRTTEIQLQEGDTLQALSIRYHCSISELKRINNLHKENEIFAHRTIKIPYRHFAVTPVHKSGDNSPTNPPKNTIDALLLNQKLSSVSCISDTQNRTANSILENDNQTENNFNQIIFNTKITQKQEISDSETSDEEVQLLPINAETEDSRTEFNCSGADWGLSWPFLLGIIIIVAFLGPLIYILYIAEHPEKYHHHS